METIVCGACGQPWTGEKCGQADNAHPYPVCYPHQMPAPYRPLSEAPIDTWVILAATGDWVGEAIYGEDEQSPSWRWAGAGPIHHDMEPLGWMPLPPPLRNPA